MYIKISTLNKVSIIKIERKNNSFFNHSYATYGDDVFDAKAVCDYGVKFLIAEIRFCFLRLIIACLKEPTPGIIR